jgi:hypothetical protein
MQHSDFEKLTKDTNENSVQSLVGDPKIAQIGAALDRGDYETAGALLRGALEKSPDDNQLLRLAAKQRKQAECFARVYLLHEETRQALEGDEFVRAVGAFREAANLSQGFAVLEQATFDIGLEEAAELGKRNWRIARSLLEEAARLNRELVIPEERWEDVRAAEREETITNLLEETAMPKPAGFDRARERLIRTLQKYPDDADLAKRLKSIETTIEEKRQWDDRQKCLKKLTDLGESMQRETDPAQVGKYVAQSEALAAPYRNDSEFSGVLEDILHQATSCENAVTALKQDRIEDCLEECAWVLSRMRHHQLFLNLKEQAEARELSLADEYSTSLAQIKALLAAGKLAEADALCSKVSARLPQFSDLQELRQEIASRSAKEDPKAKETAENVRRLLERGERSVRDQQYRLAEQSFSNALKLRPDDKKLSGHVLGLLHGYARSMVRDNPQSAEEVLQLAARVLPGSAVPPDLAEALRQKRDVAKEEAVRWASLDKLSGLNAQVESAKTSQDLHAAHHEADKIAFASAKHADVREAAIALNEKIAAKRAEFAARKARRPVIYRIISIAATLLLGVGLAYWFSNNHSSSPAPAKTKPIETAEATVSKPTPAKQVPVPAAVVPNTGSLVIRSEVPGVQVAISGKQYTVSNEPLKVELNADSYQVSGSHPGYKDFGPVTVAVGKAAETVLDVKLTPKPARLELRGAEPNTKIKLDGVLLGRAKANRQMSEKLLPGEHSIELSRNGFLTKTLTRTLGPGELVVLTKRDLQLESSDARTLTATSARRATTAHVPPAAAAPKPEDLQQWQSLDKNNPDALRAFVAKYPNSQWSSEAKRQIDAVLIAREDNDWSAIDHNNPAALQDFLKKHPDGRHASVVTNALADIQRKSQAAQAQTAEEASWKKVNQRDEASLENYVKDFPTSRFRNQAETDLANIRAGRASANESAAVLTVISRLANAWNAKDLDSILAIQKNLNKREVKAELSHVKQLAMQISPASPPQIDGSQAIVLCRRQAEQVFTDGTRKFIPESIVSYVLAKHDGYWTIEGTR